VRAGVRESSPSMPRRQGARPVADRAADCAGRAPHPFAAVHSRRSAPPGPTPGGGKIRQAVST
jgi:hypothetical protein